MKVGRKARSGRKARPVPHKPHRARVAISDPISRAFAVDQRNRRRRGLGRA